MGNAVNHPDHYQLGDGMETIDVIGAATGVDRMARTLLSADLVSGQNLSFTIDRDKMDVTTFGVMFENPLNPKSMMIVPWTNIKVLHMEDLEEKEDGNE